MPIMMALSVTLSAQDNGHHGSLSITGPLSGDSMLCSTEGQLPLRQGSVDCILIFFRGETYRHPAQYTSLFTKLRQVLKPNGIGFMMHSGELEVEVAVRIQEALLPTSLVVTTARSVRPETAFFCGPKVKEASKQVGRRVG